ncbi:MAG: hypothetical protein V4557_12385 [Bacteroidota bacterium]
MFELITPLLTAAGLHNPELEMLSMDAELYSSLLFQPREELSYADDHIRITNTQRALHKFTEFFNLAFNRNVALALTPEYSCPTAVVASLFVNQILPQENKIWIIGGASIKARELQNLLDANPDVCWFLETQLVAHNLDNNFFFNPVYHVFQTRRVADNQLQIAVVIQFKTHHLGGPALEWERDNLIKGRRIYVFENEGESIRMVTINCADIFNPRAQLTLLPQFINTPYLIIHIQLNPEPNNPNYCSYRRNIYELGRENKEFLCLNWARNLRMMNIHPWNLYGGSGIYMKPNPGELNLSDPRMINNDRKGLYYTRWKDRYADVYFFNYEEYVFEYRNKKISQLNAGLPARRRSGPEMLNTYQWNEANQAWEQQNPCSAGFDLACDALHSVGDYAVVRALHDVSPVDVERLVYLSNGKALKADWQKPFNISYFGIDDREIIGRITVTQNPDEVMAEFRQDYLMNLGSLEYEVIILAKHFPRSISNLKGNCIIGYRMAGNEDDFHWNLYPADGTGAPATGIYLGTKTPEYAADIFNKMVETFTKAEDGKRVVVWYRDAGGRLKKKYALAKPKFTDNTKKSGRSIKTGRRR